jgi:hypothetical protein
VLKKDQRRRIPNLRQTVAGGPEYPHVSPAHFGVLAGKTGQKTYILAFLLENRRIILASFGQRYQKRTFRPQLTFNSSQKLLNPPRHLVTAPFIPLLF